MPFTQFLAVNFGNDALDRLQEALMDNASSEPRDSHHNLLLVEIWFGISIMIKTIASIVEILIKVSLPITIHYSIKIFGSFEFCRIHLKMSNYLTSSKFIWNSFIEFVHLADFLEIAGNA